MFAAEPIAIDCSYSFEEAVRECVAVEVTSGHLDLGPVNTLDPEALKRAYDAFYGTSPLSSPSPSPSPSRPVSPDARTRRKRVIDEDYETSPLSTPPQSPRSPRPATPEARQCLCDEDYGTSPFSTPPQSPRSPRPTAPIAAEPLPPPTQPPPPNNAQPNSKNRRNRRKGGKRCCLKRKAERDTQDMNATPHPRSLKRIKKAETTQTGYDTRSIPSASTGFVARRDTDGGKEAGIDTLLQDPFFRLIKHQEGKPRAFVDKDGRVIAVAAGHPNDQNWEAVQQSGHEALLSAATRLNFPRKALHHRRGNFPALNVGISHGGGTTEPGNLYHEDGNTKELETLAQHPSFQRIAGFASSVFHMWAPKLHTHYAGALDALLDKHPNLQRNFTNSVFAAAAFNFGPRTCSKKHRDFANLPYGWCAVTALGSFDHTQGGHLVLWELGLILEFPAGSTILLPSAAIAHSNTSIGAHETRTSFAQFTAGGLFRWIAHGFQTDENFFKDKTPEELALVAVENEARCNMGLSFFSTFKEVEVELRLRGAK